MLFGSVSKKHVMHRDVSGSDLEKVVKSRRLGGSRILPFYTPIISLLAEIRDGDTLISLPQSFTPFVLHKHDLQNGFLVFNETISVACLFFPYAVSTVRGRPKTLQQYWKGIPISLTRDLGMSYISFSLTTLEN